ncbi:hypothetical protein AM571_PC00404 (plasmid) [Rhizobium etli 8C-3]|uniref:Uncharacterized protein n=1 Tax=Rhizobium etli 8C-3 TaxID=538025 RepID=A0A1L5PDC8_RHIET|nr:hypothetical protein AM571_PC00404 [Rhizobium etli 8C-3]
MAKRTFLASISSGWQLVARASSALFNLAADPASIVQDPIRSGAACHMQTHIPRIFAMIDRLT